MRLLYYYRFDGKVCRWYLRKDRLDGTVWLRFLMYGE